MQYAMASLLHFEEGFGFVAHGECAWFFHMDLSTNTGQFWEAQIHHNLRVLNLLWGITTRTIRAQQFPNRILYYFNDDIS